jgi:hypothetical protein
MGAETAKIKAFEFREACMCGDKNRVCNHTTNPCLICIITATITKTRKMQQLARLLISRFNFTDSTCMFNNLLLCNKFLGNSIRTL